MVKKLILYCNIIISLKSPLKNILDILKITVLFRCSFNFKSMNLAPAEIKVTLEEVMSLS